MRLSTLPTKGWHNQRLEGTCQPCLPRVRQTQHKGALQVARLHALWLTQQKVGNKAGHCRPLQSGLCRTHS